MITARLAWVWMSSVLAHVDMRCWCVRYEGELVLGSIYFRGFVRCSVFHLVSQRVSSSSVHHSILVSLVGVRDALTFPHHFWNARVFASLFWEDGRVARVVCISLQLTCVDVFGICIYLELRRHC